MDLYHLASPFRRLNVEATTSLCLTWYITITSAVRAAIGGLER